MFGQQITPAQIETNRANTVIAIVVYLEDPREYVSDGSILHDLSPALRAEPTRSGNCNAETKRYARNAVSRCAYSEKAYIVEQRWNSVGRAPIETVKFVASAKRVSAA
jgi:hypothetical protein